jgi:hypothetical protein
MSTPQQVLTNLFADYRAEWPQPYFASLFVPPPYFRKLETARPCLLIGGRGTGKTTALKSLRFDAADTRQKSRELPAEQGKYFGVYVRINKNRVRAFSAQEIDPSACSRAFAHYINVAISQELCRLTIWLESQAGVSDEAPDLTRVATAFGYGNVAGAGALLNALDRSLVELELWINNGGRSSQPIFSMAETPLRVFVETLQAAGLLGGRQIYCCVDEYENLSAQQQAIFNTYLKHSEPPLSYKIGVRRDGLHTRDTIDRGDQIATPDDYVEIDIANESFDDFALDVVQHRINQAKKDGLNIPDVQGFLPELPMEEEAILLGCERISAEILVDIAKKCPQLNEWAASIPVAKLYLMRYWEASTGEDICSLALDWKENPLQWENRLNNYGFASLFWLSRGRKGARIRKYYSGVRTFIALASGNIRYFLELIDSAVNINFEEGYPRTTAQISIDPRAQTLAARTVGKRRLDQLEGLSEHGVELKRLVLAVGKVFFELARDPAGRAPEQVSFVLSGSGEDRQAATTLLRDGVAHLAFEATPKTKATSPELRDDEYRLHPIFCAFFEYSHRKKRRITFDAGSLLKLNSSPAQAINEMLGNRRQVASPELPEQLAMFTDFFEGGE